MKFRFPLLSLAALFLLAACGGAPDKLSDFSDPSPEDSLMYYYGQMNASNFWQDALSDTILKTPDGRREFLEGFKAGLKDAGDDHSYNLGLQLGVRLAMRVRDFQNAYNLNLPEDVLIASFAAGLDNDSSIDVTEAQMNFYRIKDRYEVDKGKRENEIAKKAVAKAARGADLVMVSDTLYARDITVGKGPKFKDGDKVEIELTASTTDGHVIGKQFPPKIKVGEGKVAPVIALALKTMSNGQTRLFMTTPHALFGRLYERYFISAQDPIYFTIKANLLPDSDNLDNTPPPVL